MTKNASWEDLGLYWISQEEALDALRACQESGIEECLGAVLLVDKSEGHDLEWEEATSTDVEENRGHAWQIVDEGGNTVLAPKEAYDRNEDYDDLDGVEAPEGYVWIVP